MLTQVMFTWHMTPVMLSQPILSRDHMRVSRVCTALWHIKVFVKKIKVIVKKNNDTFQISLMIHFTLIFNFYLVIHLVAARFGQDCFVGLFY